VTPVHALRASLLGLCRYLAWSFVWGIALLLPAGAGSAWALVALGLFYHRYAARADRDPRRSTALRLRPPRASWRWVILAVPVFFVFSDSLSQLYSQLPFVTSDPGGIIDEFAGTPSGWLLAVVIVVALAPVIEEFTFRGWIQHPIEQCFGIPAGIACSTSVFAVAHMQFQWLPVYAVLGAILGWTAVDTCSIWPGVLLHATHNAGAVLTRLTNPALGRPAEAGIDFGRSGAGVALVLSSLALLYLGRRAHLERPGPAWRG
jgi:membrane protease YdiL (CAAX protease family)